MLQQLSPLSSYMQGLCDADLRVMGKLHTSASRLFYQEQQYKCGVTSSTFLNAWAGISTNLAELSRLERQAIKNQESVRQAEEEQRRRKANAEGQQSKGRGRKREEEQQSGGKGRRGEGGGNQSSESPTRSTKVLKVSPVVALAAPMAPTTASSSLQAGIIRAVAALPEEYRSVLLQMGQEKQNMVLSRLLAMAPPCPPPPPL